MNNNINTQVTLKFTDELTGESRTVECSNLNVMHNLYGTSEATGDEIRTYDRRIGKFNTSMNTIGASRLHNIVLENTKRPFYESLQNGKFWYQTVRRFNSSGSSVVIRTVSIGDSASDIFGYVVLTVDNIQGPTEVLDVTYRVIYNLNMPTYAENVRLLSKLNKSDVDSPMRGDRVAIANVGTSAYSSEYGFRVVSESSLPEALSNELNTRYKSMTVSELTDIGYRYEGAVNVTATSAYGTEGAAYTGLGATLTDPNNKIGNYPLSVVINHSDTTSLWYEDLGSLATGLGEIAVSAPTPTYRTDVNGDYHVYKITKSGNVGVAEYITATYNAGGSYSESEGLSFTSIPVSGRTYMDDDVPIDSVIPTHQLMSPNNNPMNNEKAYLYIWRYNSDYVVRMDDVGYGAVSTLGLGIQNIATGRYIHFDEHTTTILPPNLVVPIGNVAYCRNDAGTIFVACGTSGLLTVTDPLGVSPTLTRTSLSTLTLTNPIIAMSHGANGRLWFVTTDEVGFSDDNGGSWTIKPPYTIDTSVYVKDRIAGIVANPVNADELVLEFMSNTAVYGTAFRIVAWYDPTTNSCMTIPTSLVSANSIDLKLISCTANGIWMGAKKTSGIRTYLKHNSIIARSTFTSTATISSTDGVHISYFVDRLGNEVMYVPAQSGQTNHTLALPDEVCVCSLAIDSGKGLPTTDGRYDVLDGILKFGSYGQHTCDVKSNLFLIRKPRRYTTISSYTPSQAGFYDAQTIDGLSYLGEVLNDGEVYRQDSANNWSLEYNASVQATASGSSNDDIARVNFKTNSNEFHGRCYINATAAVDGKDFSTGGLTIVGTYNPVAKSINATSTTNTKYTHNEEPASVCFELHDSVNKRSIVMYYLSREQKMVFSDVDGGTATITILDPTPALIESRIVVTLSADGTTVNVYNNGVILGTNITLGTAFNMNNTSSSWVLTVGGKNWSHELERTYYYNIYKGTLTNLQVWNSVWSSTNVTTDNGDHSGLLGISGLLSQYTLTSANYAEAKVTHSASNPTVYGVDLDFNDGDLSSDSFVAGDWYGAHKHKYGYVKDNVTAISLTYSESMTTSDSGGVMSNQSGGNTVLAPTQITERFISGYSTSDKYAASGSIMSTDTVYAGSYQTTSDDMSVEFIITDNRVRVTLGFVPVNKNAINDLFCKLQINALCQTGIVILGTGATTQTLSNTLNVNDKIKISYVASTNVFSAYIWNDGTSVWDQLGTDITVTPPAIDYRFITLGSSTGRCESSSASGYEDIMITYTPPAPFMRIGDPVALTGSYKWDFKHYIPDKSGNLNLKIDGVSTPTTFTAKNLLTTNMTDVAGGATAGNPVFGGYSGYLMFHTSDIGKTITSNSVACSTAGNLPR